MEKYDVLFLHPSRGERDEFEYPLFPMGIFPIASSLSNEYAVGIVNLSLEKALSRSRFDPQTFLIHTFDFEIVAIDLHFWVHSYDSIQLAKLCKTINPDCLVVLGGYTASYFAEEILRNYPFIDIVIKGDGEIPMQSLAQNYFKRKSLKGVPNSVVRENNRIHSNPITYVPDSLDDLDFTDVSLLHNWEEHLWLYTKPVKYDPTRGETVFSPWLCIARGCSYSCSFCGGSKEAHFLCAGRDRVTLRSPEKVVDDITLLESIGVRSIEFSHGPAIVGEGHFNRILELLRKEHVDVKCSMELWKLPSIDFAKSLEHTFSNLMFRVNLGSGSEEVRRFNRGIPTSNEDFLKFIDACSELGIACQVPFSTNLPYETQATFHHTLKLMETLVLDKGIYTLSWGNLSLEPASPIFLNPSKFHVVPHLRRFQDYYDLLKTAQTGYNPSGYHTTTLSEKDSLNLTQTMQSKFLQLLQRIRERQYDPSFY